MNAPDVGGLVDRAYYLDSTYFSRKLVISMGRTNDCATRRDLYQYNGALSAYSRARPFVHLDLDHLKFRQRHNEAAASIAVGAILLENRLKVSPGQNRHIIRLAVDKRLRMQNRQVQTRTEHVLLS